MFFHAIGGDLGLVRRHHLGHRWPRASEPDEDEAVIDLVLDRLEAVCRRVETTKVSRNGTPARRPRRS